MLHFPRSFIRKGGLQRVSQNLTEETSMPVAMLVLILIIISSRKPWAFVISVTMKKRIFKFI